MYYVYLLVPMNSILFHQKFSSKYMSYFKTIYLSFYCKNATREVSIFRKSVEAEIIMFYFDPKSQTRIKKQKNVPLE